MSEPKIIFYAIVLLLLAIIGFRYSNLESGSYDLARDIEFTGKVASEPDVRDKNTKLVVNNILITVNKYPQYNYGDVLKIKGELQEPPVWEDFNYKNYLKPQGINYVMYYPQIEKIQRDPISLYFMILRLKNRLRENVYSSLHRPQADILGALILGDKNRISDNFKERLNIAGIRHIVAISGMHIVILSGLLMSLFLWLGFWKKQAAIASLLAIFLFVALTGFQISSIRAALMGSLFLIAPFFGRSSGSLRALILIALIMLTFNPYLLLYSAGFQLSFLAAAGIILMSGTLKRYVRSNIIAATFSAYIFTLPILIYSFGRISLMGPLTNLLVLPVVPVVMVLGFVAFIAGLQILFFPAWVLLTYIVRVTQIFSQPYFAQEFANIHWLWLLASYAVLFPIAHYFHKKEPEFYY